MMGINISPRISVNIWPTLNKWSTPLFYRPLSQFNNCEAVTSELCVQTCWLDLFTLILCWRELNNTELWKLDFIVQSFDVFLRSKMSVLKTHTNNLYHVCSPNSVCLSFTMLVILILGLGQRVKRKDIPYQITTIGNRLEQWIKVCHHVFESMWSYNYPLYLSDRVILFELIY